MAKHKVMVVHNPGCVRAIDDVDYPGTFNVVQTGSDGKLHLVQTFDNHFDADRFAYRLRAMRQKAIRQERAEAMRDLGLVKVRGALGGTYWE